MWGTPDYVECDARGPVSRHFWGRVGRCESSIRIRTEGRVVNFGLPILPAKRVRTCLNRQSLSYELSK